jgi:hypothetical protein
MDVKDKGEPDCYGDFIAWKQIMAIASEEKRDFILVTDDDKDDWWHYEGSRLVGPLPELRKEFRNVTGQSIWLYTTEGFLRDAKEFSEVKVDDDAMSEVKAAFDTKWDERLQRLFKRKAGTVGKFDETDMTDSWRSVVTQPRHSEETMKRHSEETMKKIAPPESSDSDEDES